MHMTNMSNDTIDIMSYGCVSNFETVACVRNGILSSLGLVTALLCIFKLIRFHMAHHKSCHQYFIFYCASLESLLGSVHWLLSSLCQFDFVLQYLKLVQFLVMCHFYWTLANRALRREQFSNRYLLPFLFIACAYFTVISVLGIINVQSTWVECLQPYWIELSAAELVFVQLFAVAGFYITRRLNEISTLDSVRWSQKRDLWCIIIVFELSALIGFLYDVTLQIGRNDLVLRVLKRFCYFMTPVGDEEQGCSGIFLHTQELYSPIFVTFMILKLLLPIWIMLYVFQPSPQVIEQEDLRPVVSEDATYTSIFNEDHHYRQLYHPTDYQSTDDTTTSSSTTSTPTGPVTTNITASNLHTITEESSSTPTNKTPSQPSPPQAKFYL